MKFKALQTKRQFVCGKTVVGIDPAKRSHHATVLDCDGLRLGKSFSFAHNHKGFTETLWHKLRERLDEINPESVIFAIECSCSLWTLLAHYQNQSGYAVVLVSPVTTHRSRPFLNHDLSHTDPKDALLIASAAQDGYFDHYRTYNQTKRAMANLSLTYCKLLKSFQQHRNRLRSFVEQYFPEFVKIVPLSTLSSRYLLSKYFLPVHFQKLDIETEALVLERISGKQHGRETLEKLKEAAQTSIGIPLAGREITAAALTLNSWLVMLDVLEEQLEAVKSELVKLAQLTPHYNALISIKGIAGKLAALFIAETRSLTSFTHFKQLEKYAGYNLRRHSSGDFVGRNHISRIGNRRLRWVVYKMTEETAKYIPEVRIKFLRRQLKSRQYRNNLVACVPELLKLIVNLVQDKRHYHEPEPAKLVTLTELETRYEQVTSKKSRRQQLQKAAA